MVKKMLSPSVRLTLMALLAIISNALNVLVQYPVPAIAIWTYVPSLRNLINLCNIVSTV